MKKIIYILLIIIILTPFIKTKTTIPKDSIRFRIIANSNDLTDQLTKKMIKKDLEQNLFPKLEQAKTKEESRQIIKDNEYLIKETIDKYNIDYTMNYGDNYFPEKEYKGVIYEEGDYESLVISLGNAKGSNWWCVMYPPLCLIESNNYEEKEYKLYIEEILSKLTS